MWKWFLGALMAISCSVPTVAAPDSVQVPIVMYHSVTSINTNDYVLSPKNFENDLRYLTDRGYTTVFLADLIAYVDGKGSLPPKPIVLSFDDGFYNNKANVLPLLEKYDCKASFMLVGKFSEREKAGEKRSTVYSYLQLDDVSEMLRSGRCEFGSHTYDMHAAKNGRKGVRKRADETDEQYRKALSADVKKNEQVYAPAGLKFSTFAYPYGYYSKQTPSVLASLGYRAVLTCNAGLNRVKRGDASCLMGLKRYNRPSRYTSADFFENVMKL